jgi:hypothetical protein
MEHPAAGSASDIEERFGDHTCEQAVFQCQEWVGVRVISWRPAAVGFDGGDVHLQVLDAWIGLREGEKAGGEDVAVLDLFRRKAC